MFQPRHAGRFSSHQHLRRRPHRSADTQGVSYQYQNTGIFVGNRPKPILERPTSDRTSCLYSACASDTSADILQHSFRFVLRAMLTNTASHIIGIHERVDIARTHSEHRSGRRHARSERCHRQAEHSPSQVSNRSKEHTRKSTPRFTKHDQNSVS